MEQVFASDYEDVYKVKNGVTLHIKKYRRVTGGYSYKQLNGSEIAKLGNYAKNELRRWCDLRIAKSDVRVSDTGHFDNEYEIVPKGSVFKVVGDYFCKTYLIEPVNDKSLYRYEIKTTGSLFNGSADDIVKTLDEIIDQIGVYDGGLTNEKDRNERS